jgi:MerR family transcriptional regulator, light-induced transcriptional regulator
MSPARSRPAEVPPECATDDLPVSLHTDGSSWSTAHAERVDAKSRLGRLVQTLEADIIPRLVHAHEIQELHHSLKPEADGDAPKAARRSLRAPNAAGVVDRARIDQFVAMLRDSDDVALDAHIGAAHQAGQPVSSIFLDLLSPSARRLGDMWLADECDFSTVTICLGRLQRLLRAWSPAFGSEVAHPPNGRRILLAQHPEEQHSFGLSMVAEFFRRDGWEVLGGVGASVRDPSTQTSKEWFDVVGFSVGSVTRLDWLRQRIAKVRSASRNPALIVMVGGPLVSVDPDLARQVGADASSPDGGKAPSQVESLLSVRLVRRAPLPKP